MLNVQKWFHGLFTVAALQYPLDPVNGKIRSEGTYDPGRSLRWCQELLDRSVVVEQELQSIGVNTFQFSLIPFQSVFSILPSWLSRTKYSNGLTLLIWLRLDMKPIAQLRLLKIQQRPVKQEAEDSLEKGVGKVRDEEGRIQFVWPFW